MAEAKKKEEAQEAGEAKPAGGKKKLIIMIVVALATIGISVGATIFFLGGSSKHDAPAEGADAHETEAAAGKGPALYLAIEPAFLVTLDDNGRQRYMKVDLSVQAREKASVDAVTHHMPLIRSRVLSTYSSTNFAEIQTDQGKQKMIEKTLAEINGVLKAEGAPLIENVFFTNFVLQ